MKNIEHSWQMITAAGSMLAALNDFLAAAVKDFLPSYDASGLTKVNSERSRHVAQTLVGNMLKVLQFICDKNRCEYSLTPSIMRTARALL